MFNQGEENTSRLITAIGLFNDHITSKLRAFKKANRQAKITLVDTSRAFNTAVKNPTAYGAPDALCINPDGVSCVSHSYHIQRENANDELALDGWLPPRCRH